MGTGDQSVLDGWLISSCGHEIKYFQISNCRFHRAVVDVGRHERWFCLYKSQSIDTVSVETGVVPISLLNCASESWSC